MTQIDQRRLSEELKADEEVLASLAANGDDSSVVRPIDVHFKGPQPLVEALADDAAKLGFRFIGYSEYDDDDLGVDLQVDSRTDRASIAALTRLALQIEQSHDVEYDGWGCPAAQAGPAR